MRRKRDTPAPLRLELSESIELGPLTDHRKFLAALGRIFDGAVLYLEGRPAPEVRAFLESLAISPALEIAKGTLWPKSSKFHIPIVDSSMQSLAAFTSKFAVVEIAEHLVVYEDSRVLLTAYDMGVQNVCIRSSLPRTVQEAVVRAIR